MNTITWCRHMAKTEGKPLQRTAGEGAAHTAHEPRTDAAEHRFTCDTRRLHARRVNLHRLLDFLGTALSLCFGLAPLELHAAPNGDIFVLQESEVIRVDPATGAQSVVASGGLMSWPFDIVVEATGKLLLIQWPGSGNTQVIRVDPVSGQQTVLSQQGLINEDGGSMAIAPNGDIFVLQESEVIRVDPATGAQSVVASGGLMSWPFDIVVEATGKLLLIQWPGSGNTQVIRVDPVSGQQTVLSQQGLINEDGGSMAIAPNGDIFVLQESEVIRVDPATGAQSVVASGGLMSWPFDIVVEATGKLLLIQWPGSGNTQVIRVDPVSGQQTVLSQQGLINEDGGSMAIQSPASTTCQPLNYTGFHQGGPPFEAGVPPTFGPGGSSTENYGCALCSAASMLSSFGVITPNGPITPDLLNTYLLQGNAYSPSDDICFDKIQSAISALIHIHLVTGYSTLSCNDFLTEHICGQGERVILQLSESVNGVVKSGYHYILVTGIPNNNDWNVFDPGWKNPVPNINATTLSGHLAGFTTYDSSGNAYQRTFTVHGYRPFQLDSASSFVARVHSPVELLVIDPIGRRIGFDPTNGIHYFEVMDADYFQEGPLADADANGPTLGDPSGMKTVYVPSPLAGQYQVIGSGTGSGPYVIDVETAGTAVVASSTFYSGVASAGARFTNSLPVVIRPFIQAVTRTGNTIMLSSTTSSDLRYQVQYSGTLSPSNWSNLGGDFTATNSAVTIFDSITNSPRFYRIVLLPQ